MNVFEMKITRIEKEMATKDDLKNFATKDDLKNFATKDDLKNFATKDDLKNFATKDDLKNFATKQDLKDGLKKCATKDDIRLVIDHIDSFYVQGQKFESIRSTIANHEGRLLALEQKLP